jgi:hypothetical protein
MKKILILLSAVFTLGLTSCNMDELPYDAIDSSKALETMVDFENQRVGIYSDFRFITTGGYILAQELQADAFNAVLGFSNTYGEVYRWNFDQSMGTASAIFGNLYSTINKCNFVIEGAKKAIMPENLNLTEQEKVEIAVIQGEIHALRAFCYLRLTDFFCEDYDPATAETQLGMPLQLIYAPTSDASKYPGRSSMKATFEQIMKDLDEAVKLVTTAGAPRSNYITLDAVKAIKARAALQMDDYATASTLAAELCDANTYPLLSVDEADEYVAMWKNDTGSETIWQMAMKTAEEKGSETGTLFIGVTPDGKDYIPAESLVNLYDEDADIRFAAYFKSYNLTVSSGASGEIKFFNKYPGNDLALSVDNTSYANAGKPLRISEMYLVAAEAYAQANDLTKASKYLNALKAKRIADYVDVNYASKEVFMVELKNERFRELVGEGFRMVDLKRWGDAVKRTPRTATANLILFPGQADTDALNRASNDYRILWPIPKAEVDANPQLKGQQNPGY